MSRSGILVASPQMVDVFFAKAVVLLCEFDADGALGIVVNRITGIESDKVLDQMEIDQRTGIQAPVHWGGPVQPGAVFLTFRGDVVLDVGDEEPDEHIFQVAPSLGVSPSKDVIKVVAGREAERDAFLSLGYAGWGAGQLDGEIQSGSWIFMEVEEQVLFDMPPEDRYDWCINSLGVEKGLLWMTPVDE